jgi:hypothetical protein
MTFNVFYTLSRDLYTPGHAFELALNRAHKFKEDRYEIRFYDSHCEESDH